MEDFEISVPESKPEDDLLIIYKGREEREGQIFEPIEEIRTSKEEFLRKLRYFKQKSNEINYLHEIFIHDVYPIKIFKDFINTIKTGKLSINDSNYSDFYKLSCKYEYQELQQQIDQFSKTRPDLLRIVTQYCTEEIDYAKEAKISQNLDICLRNPHLAKYPIEKLNRILNSPERRLNDYCLLYEFVKKIIKERKNEINNDDLSIFVSSLDYLEMSNEELDDFLNDDTFSSIFGIRNSREKIKMMNEERKRNEMRITKLEENIEKLERKITDEKSKIEDFVRLKIDEIQFNFLKEKDEIVSKHQQENQKLRDLVEKQAKKISENEERIQRIEETQEKVISQKIDEFQKNFSRQQEEMLKKYQQEKQKIKDIESQSKKIIEYESRIQALEEATRKITGSISIGVEKTGAICGRISIKDDFSVLDKSKSRYLISKNNSNTIEISEYNNGQPIKSLQQEFKFEMPKGTYFIHAILVDNYGKSRQLVSDPATTKGAYVIIEYTGHVHAVNLSRGLYKLEVWGAEGGETSEYSVKPGRGGYSCGTLKLIKETMLYVYVGGKGNGSSGGWNGGGSAQSPGAGGGGSTDISLYGEVGSQNWNNKNHLYSRIIVAGAGGGAGHNNYQKWSAGCGGGENGEDGKDYNEIKGGMLTGCGKDSFVSADQGFGVGGSNRKYNHNSGGGGGWYGGCACDSQSGCWGRSGAGGSGYVYNSSTAKNYPSGCKLDSSFYLSDSKTIAGNTEFPNVDGSGQERGHCGNGYAKITLI